ncbi:MAG: hypothetical protein Tsb009_35090 [Planctomycetaceae bacterium]
MIGKQTVFVLGAGASVPYGFPTGVGLRNKIIELNKTVFRNADANPDHFRSMLKTPLDDQANLIAEAVFLANNEPFSPNEIYDQALRISQLIDRFERSRTLSIDRFLSRRNEPDKTIGKCLIAYFLIQHENERALHNEKNNCWFSYVSALMDSESPNDYIRNVSFITFNYDRSLEHLFHQAITHGFRVSPQEANQYAAKIPIVHLHGRLGYLEWQDNAQDALIRNYNHHRTPETIAAAAQEINIISENVENSVDFQQAHDLLSKAEVVYFLGFGYDEENVRRLNLDENLIDCEQVFGMWRGITKSEVRRIQKSLPANFMLAKRAGRIGCKCAIKCGCEIVDYLRNTVHFL